MSFRDKIMLIEFFTFGFVRFRPFVRVLVDEACIGTMQSLTNVVPDGQ